MLNPDLHLNHKIFDKDVEKTSMREAFGKAMLHLAEMDKRVVALCADLSESVHLEMFREKYPERFIELGVAEQNLAGVASGMAAMGKIPFMASYAVFSPGRNWEQIRTTIAYNNTPVKIVSSHVGVSVGPDGGSHQALEDIALMRVLPRMTVISPCDAMEIQKAVLQCAKNNSPTYIRMVRDKVPVITSENTHFAIGKNNLLWKPKRNEKSDALIVATGSMVYPSLLVAHKLESSGKNVSVLNISSIKPLDENVLSHLALEARAVVTAEEHQIAGGMGSAVAEFLSQNHPVPIEMVGVKDAFGQSGTSSELLEHYGLTEKNIEEAVRRALIRKLS